ncbi:unnamed protein product, partial [Brugia pahangi]|uniref:Protein-tyrosine-phosphatase n=1 Tax=Brugia pahangi TaxID=6280 RepID=A0A0N4TB40_BRUPA
DETLTTSTPAESNTILSETAATAVVLSQSGITQTTTTASVAFESEQTEQSSAPDQIVAKFIWNLDAPPFVSHNLINNLSCPILNGIRTSDALLPILSTPIVNSSHRQNFTSIDQITLAIQSRPSIVHAKPSQSRNFPFVQRSGDGIVMPACYSGQFQQITPMAAAATTTSGSIRGNVAMSGYNYYSMPAYYTTSVTQTTLYNQTGTIYGASGNIGQPSGYGISMSGYYQMPVCFLLIPKNSKDGDLLIPKNSKDGENGSSPSPPPAFVIFFIPTYRICIANE